MAWSANQFTDFTINRSANKTVGFNSNKRSSFINNSGPVTNTVNRQNCQTRGNNGSSIQTLEELTPGSTAVSTKRWL
jgi:hypothetical protein